MRIDLPVPLPVPTPPLTLPPPSPVFLHFPEQNHPDHPPEPDPKPLTPLRELPPVKTTLLFCPNTEFTKFSVVQTHNTRLKKKYRTSPDPTIFVRNWTCNCRRVYVCKESFPEGALPEDMKHMYYTHAIPSFCVTDLLCI